MSKLEELLQGVKVEWKLIEEVADLYNGLNGKTKVDFSDGNAEYVTYKNIYNNIEVDFDSLELVKVESDERQSDVQYGDILFTSSSESAIDVGMSCAVTTEREFKVYLNSFSFGLRFKPEFKLIPEFTKYLFRSKSIRDQIIKTASGVTRYNVSKKRFIKIPIPIPTIEIQQEIVRVLDELTDLTNQLKKELETERQNRKKQFEYYREELFRFDGKEVEWKTFGDLGEIIRGNGLQKTDFTESGFGCIHYGQIYTYYGNFATQTKSFVSKELAEKLKKVNKGDLIITNTSENIEDVCKAVAWLGEDEIVTGGHACILKHNQNPKYLVYYTQLNEFFRDKKKLAKGTKVMDVSAKDLAKIKVPIPSLAEQERIVSLLDKLNENTMAVTKELENEINLTTKQYEYYREKLLTF